jgi:hypothetical protein
MLTRSSIVVGVLALVLPAIASAQSPAAPAGTGRSSVDRGGPSLTPPAAIAGKRLRPYFRGAETQRRFPTASGFAPYMPSGVEAVTISNADDPTFGHFDRVTGGGDLGAESGSPSRGYELFSHGSSYIYNFDRAGFNPLWVGGVSIPLEH